MSSFFRAFAEVSTKFRNRPEKRTGGGGYGQMKTMNTSEKKSKIYKPAPNMKKAHHMQYARWSTCPINSEKHLLKC